MDIKHAIIQDIRDVATKIGDVPSRREYLEHGTLGGRFESAFGTWTNALKACGLQRKESSIKKQVNEFYSRDVKDLLSKPSGLFEFKIDNYIETLCVGDAHFPWVSADALSGIYSLVDILKPKRIIQMGDLYDYYSFSRFPRSHYIIRPDEEVLTGRKMALDFWTTIRKLSPKAELIQIRGNHDVRPHKRLFESGLSELEIFMDFKSLFNFEGVVTFQDPRENIILDGINFTHGHLQSMKHRASLKSNVVHAHTHKGGLEYSKVQGEWLFELDCGFIGDPLAKAMGYTAKANPQWQLGAGFISRFGPHFIPFK